MFNHSRTGSHGSNHPNVPIGDQNGYYSRGAGAVSGQAGSMMPSSGQSYLIEKTTTDFKYNRTSTLIKPQAAIDTLSSHNWIMPKKDFSYTTKDFTGLFEKSEIFRTEPIKANRDLIGGSNYGSGNKIESSYNPAFGDMAASRYEKDYTVGVKPLLYSTPTGSPVSKKYSTSDPNTYIRPEPSKAYGGRESQGDPYYIQRDSTYVPGRYSQNSSGYLNSQFIAADRHSATGSRESSVKKKLNQFREMLEQAKRDDEKFKLKQKALDEELEKKRKMREVYDPTKSKVDYLELLKDTLANKRSRSSQFQSTLQSSYFVPK